MKQITIMIDNDQQAKQIVEMLSDFDAIRSINVDPTWSANEQNQFAIRIIESDIGPMISHSRTSVYDVMEAYDEGYSPSEIGNIYNLSPHQVDVALAYISKNRVTLEPELQELLQKKAENEAYHRALVAEREKQFIREMTPERIKFNELLEQSRRSRGAI
jgi:uncharacterized protein (DUF433 family)